jgi:GTPase SAR1 family protein
MGCMSLVHRIRRAFTVTGFDFTFLSIDFLSMAGFNVETVEYKNISFTVWDVGGQDKVRKCSATLCCTLYAPQN